MNQSIRRKKNLPVGSPVRKHLDFYGRVQGVGFRYTAYSVARAYGLTGWVRNCYDGHVEMEIQGNEERIQAMIEEIQSDCWIRIDRVEPEARELVANETEFKVTG